MPKAGMRNAKKTNASKRATPQRPTTVAVTLAARGVCTRARAAGERETVQLGLGDARARLWPELGLRLGLGFELR